MEIKINKEQLRKQVLDLRNSIDKDSLASFSRGIVEQLRQLQEVKYARKIMCFVSFGSEVHTHGLIKSWLAEGKSVSVPCLQKLPNGIKTMHAVKISDFSDLKVRGSYGILEPELKSSTIILPQELDLVIVPGAAFDLKRNRIGYGGGFYDRFLKQTSNNCKRISVCFDFQIFESIPYEDYDIPVDLIVSDKRII